MADTRYRDFVLHQKHVPRTALAQHVKALRVQRRVIGFTNGCFDILHPGHLELLYFAKSRCDLLFVALNSDAGIRRLKGGNRPVFPLEHRLLMVGGYGFVDFVLSFDEDTPLELIRLVQPDVLVKGSDWGGRIVGEDVVRARGGRVIAYPLVQGMSTTGIIARIHALG